MQARERARQHDEARTGELGGRIEVHETELLAERDVIERRERELRRRAPAPHLDVRLGVGAVGNGSVQQVRQPGLEVVELGRERRQPRLAARELVAELADLALQRFDVATGGLRAADRLRALVARLAQALDLAPAALCAPSRARRNARDRA